MKNSVFWDVMPCGSYKNIKFRKLDLFPALDGGRETPTILGR
jgi:hypothetical protein